MQFLAILKVKPDTPREKLGPLMKPEAAHVWEMTTTGMLRSIHYIKGPVGAVLMLESVDEQEAEKHVKQLPMVEQGLLSVEILPLTPFTGFAALFASPTT
jgi:hypothetical protein